MICFHFGALFFPQSGQPIAGSSEEAESHGHSGLSEIPRKVGSRLRDGGSWGRPLGPWQLLPAPSPHTSQPHSFISFGFSLESCFLFALTRQKLPPFCQLGYLRTQGLVGTRSLRQHRVDSGLLQDYATAGRHTEDSGQWPGDQPQAPGPLVQPLNSDKEEL